ncbi:hypothetical protein [Cellulosimicrobium marinum]|uniref:hypothetical protein n=1 Tax=Cellulosimicrobium marinum TaxID=1638992 RepID=UPI001E5D2F09|nr:hypothetical protein [Cellulosimicrobium marinum]MCB7137451.1 hypothetical protein [Cellulosimicrobium marinum]
MTAGSAPQPAGDSEVLLAMYSALVARHQSSDSRTWQLVGIAIAAEVALWIGLGQSLSAAFYLLIGLGALAVSVVSILAIRYTELSSMLDRQLLGAYEDHFGVPTELRLHHDLRLEDRLWEMSGHLSPERRSRLFKRRIAKRRPSERRAGDAWVLWRVDMVLSALGQPSIVFTAILALAGCLGLGLGVYQASASHAIAISITALSLVVLALPWFTSMDSVVGGRLRNGVSRILG